MARYAIWDKTSEIITPSGAVFTAEEWKDKYPVAKSALHIVCGGGVINGTIFMVYEQMLSDYMAMGCDFTGCVTFQDHLDRMEEFDELRNRVPDTGESTAEERIAAALEMQNLLAMDTVHDDDPDAE